MKDDFLNLQFKPEKNSTTYMYVHVNKNKLGINTHVSTVTVRQDRRWFEMSSKAVLQKTYSQYGYIDRFEIKQMLQKLFRVKISVSFM